MGNRKRKKKIDRDICERCGQCCRIKRYFSDLDLWVAYDEYCVHFEWIQQNGRKIGNCKIYDSEKYGKFVMPELGIKCIRAEDMVRAGLQPSECPYSKKVPNYQCRVINL